MKYEKIFLSIVFPLTYLISILFLFRGLNEILSIIMILPAFAAIVSILIEYRSFKELIKPFFQEISIESIVFTIVFPLVLILLCLFLALLTRRGALLTSWVNLFMNIGSIVLLSIVFFVVGLFEEYGWRGYLLPRFIKRFTFNKASFITGIIVVCYNLPIIVILNFHFEISKAITYILLESAAIFAMNYAFTYLFTLSQNIILLSIMRTLWNNLNLSVLGYSYKLLPVCGYVIGKPQLINGEGLFGLIFLSIFAIYVYKRFSKQIA